MAFKSTKIFSVLIVGNQDLLKKEESDKLNKS